MKRLRQFDVDSYRILAELSESVMFEWEIQSDYFFASSNWKLKFGYEPITENFSQNLEKIFLIHPEDKVALLEYVNAIKNSPDKLSFTQNYLKIEMRLKNKDKEYIWFRLRLILRYIDDAKPDRVLGMLTNIDEEKKEYELLRYQAQKDLLTGLYNKITVNTLITEYLDNSCLPHKKQALFIIDIDGFKEVNDHLGHLFGDAVIADLAQRIEKTFRETDIVGRIGGDEFIVLIKNISKLELIEQKAQELLKYLKRTYSSNGASYAVSASIGIALCPDHGTLFTDLFNKADHALYYVKEHGKNNYALYHQKLPQPAYSNTRIAEQKVDSTNRRKKSFHENVIEYIFKILYHTKDANVAINLILEVIGQKYDISRMFILERTAVGGYVNTFEWCNYDVESRQAEQQDIPKEAAEKFKPYFDENGIFSCVNIAMLPNELRQYFAGTPVRALLECQMVEGGIQAGLIGFEYNEYARMWKSDEIESLSFTAEILSTFLLKKRAMDKLQTVHLQTLEILDNIDSFVYVIDKNSHETLFLNKKAIEFFGANKIGGLCYEFISCEAGPCDYCPMLFLTDSLDHTIQEVYLPKRKLWFRAAVSRLQWTEGRDVCLLHCHDITAYKTK